jgi:hypothetical protein
MPSTKMIDTPHPASGPTAPAVVESVRALEKSASPAVRAGLYTGALLVLVMIVSLIVANRMPWLESRALERNAACYGLFVLFMLIPVARFWNRPVRMFSSGVLAWTMFVVAYDLSGFFFRNLFQILRSPFEALLEGILVYGVCAVIAWVGGMALLARLTPIAPRRRKSDIFQAHEE